MTPHEHIIARWRTLARTAATITPSQVNGEPNVADAQAIIEDFYVLIHHVDALVLSIGEYAAQSLGISQSDVKEHFTDCLLGALEGNALFVIEEAPADYAESKADQRADHEYDRRRDDKLDDR